MFNRNILHDLKSWRQSRERKPLILRGARQVGKTTCIHEFAKQFDCYIYLNLEIKADRDLFEQELEIDALIQAIHFHKGASISPQSETLIFIDEIQNSSKAVASLRYFYEQQPNYYVIAAGSLLESLIDTHISFPVGRVNYKFMYPMTFTEFLSAHNQQQALDVISQIPCPSYAHKKLLTLFHKYTLIGGFPEAISRYLENSDISAVQATYNDLLLGYMDDVEKYARNRDMTRVIRHAIANAPLNAGKRIKFQGFGHSNYGSKEMGEALRTLEKAMLLKLIYPTTSTEIPAELNHKKSPRLQFIDTGLINYSTKLQQHYFSVGDLNSIYKGKIAKHIVGQELLANGSGQGELKFWIREKPQSTAKIDYLIPFEGMMIPIEVKSGKTGTLKSLHQFMDRCNHSYAIRLYANTFHTETVQTQTGKSFKLINLPYYLAGLLSNNYLRELLKI